jgi:hypothetical protein
VWERFIPPLVEKMRTVAAKSFFWLWIPFYAPIENAKTVDAKLRGHQTHPNRKDNNSY